MTGREIKERVVVAGGGFAGLAAALAFARAGHPVIVLERDEAPLAATAAEAFAAERRGAPQAHQTHGFLARVRVLMRDRFPDVLDALVAEGCTTMPTVSNLGEPQPGDEDLAVLIARRTTFEWVLRAAVLAESSVELRTGVVVTGVSATHASIARSGVVPVIDGVTTSDGQRIAADIVVGCTGRRGDVPEWLRPHAVEVSERVHESGLMYMSHWYRLPENLDVAVDPKLGGDLGFVKYLAVPGDGGTLSVTLAIRSEDRELRDALRSSASFERACRVLPGPNRFFQGEHPLQPLGTVRPMAGLLNRIRRFTADDGTPTVLGFHAVGDAHTCTNPLYGRGCSLAVVQAVLLADAAAAHPGDAVGRAEEYELGCRREVRPWWQISVQMDRLGADPAGLAGLGPEGGPGRNGIAAVFAAAATDPVIGRGLARFWNILATPAELMADPELISRIAAVMADPGAYPGPAREGPSRRELLDTLAVRR